MTSTATTAAAAAAAPDSSGKPAFSFPREYSFPPFFTRQTNLTIHHAQLAKWSALVLAYARHHRIFKLALSAAADSDLFYNRRLDRRLGMADVRELLEFMRRDGRAEYVSGGGHSASSENGGGSGAGGVGGGSDIVFIYWRKPEEWARKIEKYVEETGQKGSVLTVYELVEGEGTRGTDIHGIDNDVLLKALNILVKKGRAQIFGQDDSQGVKFF